MSDYIKREDAIKAIREIYDNAWDAVDADDMFRDGLLEARDAVMLVPSADVVEVVRCKDCKYLKPYTSQYGSGQYCECPCSFGGQGIKKPDDYCSYGERRDDKEYNNSILNARKGEE